MSTRYGLVTTGWSYQGLSNFLMDDVITIAPTGSGKSMTYWMPVLFIKYGISVIVTPLKLLGAQFSEMLEGVGISAVSITAANTANELFDVRDSSNQLLSMANCK